MNIKTLFKTGSAKLENLVKHSKDLFLSSAIQRVYIEVNEEGAEAKMDYSKIIN